MPKGFPQNTVCPVSPRLKIVVFALSNCSEDVVSAFSDAAAVRSDVNRTVCMQGKHHGQQFEARGVRVPAWSWIEVYFTVLVWASAARFGKEGHRALRAV